jgi:hypothetical protein
MKTMAVRTLAAFKAAVKKLKALTTTTSKPLRGYGTIICPYPRNYVDSDGILQEFTYDKDQPSRERLIFYGTNTSGGARICVKFARRYSPHAHRFCASKGHAPQLIAFNPLPGGWNMIVMGVIDISFFPFRAGSYQHFMPSIPGILLMKESITTLIKGLHAKGYVHGDVRGANIFVQVPEDHEGTVISNFMLVDFDWAGPVGETRYPLGVNQFDIYRPKNARGGNKILPDDDLAMLKSLFPLKRKQESTPDVEATLT